MANPSLQIGNSNWAIKEDNLLGYSTAGTRFVPQPITMTRASAGTRVNSSGLVETVELLGSEEVTGTNSDMSGANSWVGGLGSLDFNINTTVANKMWCNFTTGNQQVTLLNTLTAGKTYFVSLTARLNSGTATTVMVGGFTSNQASNAVFNIIPTSTTITYTGYITADNTSLSIGIITANNNGSDYEFDNVSVKESTKNNLARVDYDGTASSLLVEPERTNLFPYSEDFSGYSQGTGTITDNSTTSPDGTLNASVFNALVGVPNFYTRFTATVGLSYAQSIFLKKGTRNWVTFVKGGGSGFAAWFDLENGVIGTVASGFSANMENYGNGWYRCSVISNATITLPYFQVVVVDNNDSTTNSVAGTIFIWGTQAEQGSYATSYIPTDGGTVTRVQDQYSKTGISDLINSEEGVLFLEIAAFVDEAVNRQISISDNSPNNFIAFSYSGATNNINATIKIGGVVNRSFDYVLSDVTQESKIAIRYSNTEFSFWVDGTETSVNTLASSFSEGTLNRLALDSGAGSQKFYGKVKQLQVFKTALTDTELIALTS